MSLKDVATKILIKQKFFCSYSLEKMSNEDGTACYELIMH